MVTNLNAPQPRPPSPPGDRAYWITVLRRLADPVLTNLAQGTLKARMPVEQAAGSRPPNGDASRGARPPARRHRAVARAWRRTAPPRVACAADYADLARRAIARAVDPASPDFLNFTRDRQPLVDAAFLAQALLRAPTRAARRARRRRRSATSIAALESTRVISPAFNNWLLFSATVEAALAAARRAVGPLARRLRAPPARAVVQGRRRLRRRRRLPLGLLQQLRHPSDAARRAGRVRATRMPAWKELVAARRAAGARYAAIQERLIAPDGTFPAIGRSLAYRCGAFQLLAQMALRRALPDGVSPAQVRGALTAVIRRSHRGAGHVRSRRLAADRLLRPPAGRRRDLHFDGQPVSLLGRLAAARPAGDRRVLVSAAAAVDGGARRGPARRFRSITRSPIPDP